VTIDPRKPRSVRSKTVLAYVQSPKLLEHLVLAKPEPGMAQESANELLRRIEGLQEELRVVSDRLVKLETSGIHQELRVVTDRLARLETGVIQEEQIALSTAEQEQVVPEKGDIDPQRLEAGMLPGPSETETEQFQTRKSRKITHKSVIITESDHPLQESFWDALLLAGLDEIGPAGSAVITFGVLSSFGLQLLFVWIVLTSFLSSDPKYDIQHLKNWRVLYGHNYANMDSSGASLVSKICGGALFEREWWHNSLLDEVDAYLDPVFPGMFPDLSVGVVLSSVALAIWVCYIAAELQDAGRFAWSIYRLPGGNTVISMVSEDERVFESVSRLRRTAVSFTVLARLGIAVTLGISGGLWLAHTRDVTNIMLNAVALLFILEIDELLWKVVASRHTTKYLSSVRTLQLGPRKTWAGVDVACILRLIMIIVALVIFIQETVCINAIQAKTAKEILCGGNKDFVYHSSPQLGPIMVMDTKPFDIQGGSWQPGIRSLVEEVVTRYDPKDLDTGYWRSHLGDRKVVAQTAPKRLKQIFTAATKLTAVTAPDDNLVYGNSCEDQLPSELEWEWSALTAMTGAKNCSEAQRFCDDTRFPLVRMACPETCGCTAVDSGMFMDTGCRQKCQNQPAFKASRENASCLDFSTTYFNDTRSEAWARYMRDWDRLLWSMAPNMTTMKEMSELFSVLEFVDCAFLQEIDMLDLLMCKPDPVEMFGGDSFPMTLRTGAWLCPASCGCSGLDTTWCPRCSDEDPEP